MNATEPTSESTGRPNDLEPGAENRDPRVASRGASDIPGGSLFPIPDRHGWIAWAISEGNAPGCIPGFTDLSSSVKVNFENFAFT